MARLKEESERFKSSLHERFAAADDRAREMGKMQRDLFDVQANAVPLQYEKEKLVREKDALEKQNKWLDEELQAKAAELRDLKHLQAQQVADLQARLDEAEARGSASDAAAARLEQRLSEKSVALEQASAELRDERSRGAGAVANFEAQVSAERKSGRLADELKQLAELALGEREKDLAELRKTQEEFEAKWAEEREALGREVESRKAEALASLEAKPKQVDDLTAQLEKCQSDLAQHTTLAASAAAAAAAAPTASAFASSSSSSSSSVSALTPGGINTAAGLSVMEIFKQLQDKDAELRSERSERKRLELNLDSILKELERKAPILEGQRRDYKRALVAHNKLSEKLEEVLKEEKRLKEEASAADAAKDEADKENRMLKQQNADLSRQVQHLLKSQVDRSLSTPGRAGGFKGPSRTPQTPSAASGSGSGSSPTSLSAHGVITEKLVTMTDIEDMQRNNQALIATVRTLTDELEKKGTLAAQGEVLALVVVVLGPTEARS